MLCVYSERQKADFGLRKRSQGCSPDSEWVLGAGGMKMNLRGFSKAAVQPPPSLPFWLPWAIVNIPSLGSLDNESSLLTAWQHHLKVKMYPVTQEKHLSDSCACTRGPRAGMFSAAWLTINLKWQWLQVQQNRNRQIHYDKIIRGDRHYTALEMNDI